MSVKTAIQLRVVSVNTDDGSTVKLNARQQKALDTYVNKEAGDFLTELSDNITNLTKKLLKIQE